jgi:hypothetical protein
MHDLAEHTGTLLALISSMAGIIGIFIGGFVMDFRHRLKKMEERQTKLREEVLPDEYVKKDSIEELKGSIDNFTEQFYLFMKSCHEGNCFMAQVFRLAQSGAIEMPPAKGGENA